MNFLTIAFALGGLAIAFPILFHLIRPTPKGSQTFGSLMFLRESPPRISKRNRIDHWLLLLMRALVVLLLAAAFMRPFFRTGSEIFVSDMPGNRVVILVDRSASMKRGDLWEQARQQLDDVLDGLQPVDDVALLVFDDQLETLVGFSDDQVVDIESRKAQVRNQFKTIDTGWGSTDMGAALAAAADVASEMDEEMRAQTGLQVVVISDLQSGADLDALQTYLWPKDVRVRVAHVSPEPGANATARALPDRNNSAIEMGRRVRVVNSEHSNSETFSVIWSDSNGAEDERTRTEFYVPAGTSQILRVPLATEIVADRLRISGDDFAFDNQCYVSANSHQEIAIAYFGSEDPDDAKQCFYFLDRVIPKSNNRDIKLTQYSPNDDFAWQSGVVPGMVVVTAAVASSVMEKLASYVKRGGLVLVATSDPEVFSALRELFPAMALKAESSDSSNYAMLGNINFRHPLFQPLSGARFNDFTNIRFWNHLSVKEVRKQTENGASSNVIARFDDRSVAVWQSRLGEGLAVGMASSWKPEDSQLALSTKFVPLVSSLLGMTQRSSSIPDSFLPGENVSLPDLSTPWNVSLPDGSNQELEVAKSTRFELRQPGIYGFENGDQGFQVAVNLDPDESITHSMGTDRLESFGVRLGDQPSREELAGSLRKLKDKQLENRQRIWKWLLLAAICLIVLETLVAGMRSQSPVSREVVA